MNNVARKLAEIKFLSQHIFDVWVDVSDMSKDEEDLLVETLQKSAMLVYRPTEYSIAVVPNMG